MKTWILPIVLFCTLSVTRSQADWIGLPDSRDQQFRTFGLFIDNQSSILYTRADRAWGSLGLQEALVENTSWAGSPQLVMYASANAGFRFNERHDTLLTETIDARVGLLYEASITDRLRYFVGWMHQSGHVSDDVQDLDLFGSNLGNELILARLIYDIPDRFRLGGTIGPIVGSDPGEKRFYAEQFGEWFFTGTHPIHSLTPYLAGGVIEGGEDKVRFTFHTQVGAYVGNHLDPIYKPNLRLVVGYYNGVDPRLKYAQFKDSVQNFWYAGAMFGI